mgnify:CR=1 FL=1
MKEIIERIEREAVADKLQGITNRLRVAIHNELADYLYSRASYLTKQELKELADAIALYANDNLTTDITTRTERIRQYLQDALNQASSH